MSAHSATERAKKVLAVVAATLEQRAGDLSALDAALGDGDHGVSLTIGFRNVMAAIRESDAPDGGVLLERVGMTLVNSVGGAMGPLFGTAFISAGKAAAGRTSINGDLVAVMLEAARDAVMARGKARPGEKTMVDALAPAAEAARQAADAGADALVVLSAASDAAMRGAVATREMLARIGRASRLGERSRGHQDAGATSVAVMLAAARAAFDPAGAPGVAVLPPSS